MALIAALVLYPFFNQPIGWAPIAVAAFVIALSAVRTFEALLVLAAVLPISGSLFVLIRTGTLGLRFSEALMLAFVGGWALRRIIRPRRLVVTPAILWSAVALIGIAVASATIDAVILAAEQPDRAPLEVLGQAISRDYFSKIGPLTAALLFIESVVLLLIVADENGADDARRGTLLRMMVVGAGAAALINLLRLLTAAIAQEHWWSSFLTYLTSVRTDLNIVDLNAAGSYFVMIAGIAAGLAWRERRFVAGLALTLMGMWIAGSRVAIAAGLLVCVGALVIRLTRSHRRLTAAIAAIVLVAVIAVAGWTIPLRRNASSNYAFAFRMEMARAALQLTATNPIWGIGLGRFYPLSAAYSSIPENAHNNYLQILAELGGAGLVCFVIVVALTIRHEVRRPVPPGPSWGLLGGLAAFLLTCIGGHPLLVPIAAYAFWTVLGIAAAGAPISSTARAPKLAALAALIVIAVMLPIRIKGAVQDANLERAAIGMGRLWQHDADGTRFRWAAARSTFFVPSSARTVRIPLRLPDKASNALEVRILVDGREANRVLLQPGPRWQTVLLLQPQRASADFLRIDLEARQPGSAALLEGQVTSRSGVLMVGRPIVEQQ
jgi:hypothetical protein